VLADINSSYTSIVTSVFSSTIAAKAAFATAAILLACLQLLTAARIYGRLQSVVRLPDAVVSRVHRYSGRLAFLCTLPVVFHCVFILGFQTASTRVAIHSILGSFFYGLFAAKVLFVRDHSYPSWVLPLAGGLLFVALIGAWWTSSFWFFRQVGEGL